MGRPRGVKHGMSGSATWQSWKHAVARCKHDPRYAGRGIIVCDRWLTFENFLSDMGERPLGTSLDRIDNDGNYEPGNCRWATQSQQMRNTRRNHNLTINGITKTLTDWALAMGVKRAVVDSRLRAGWSPEEAVKPDGNPPRPPQMRRGSRHHGARFTESDVMAIRRRHSAGESIRTIARSASVDKGTISYIVRRLTWRHVP